MDTLGIPVNVTAEDALPFFLDSHPSMPFERVLSHTVQLDAVREWSVTDWAEVYSAFLRNWGGVIYSLRGYEPPDGESIFSEGYTARMQGSWKNNKRIKGVEGYLIMKDGSVKREGVRYLNEVAPVEIY